MKEGIDPNKVQSLAEKLKAKSGSMTALEAAGKLGVIPEENPETYGAAFKKIVKNTKDEATPGFFKKLFGGKKEKDPETDTSDIETVLTGETEDVKEDTTPEAEEAGTKEKPEEKEMVEVLLSGNQHRIEEMHQKFYEDFKNGPEASEETAAETRETMKKFLERKDAEQLAKAEASGLGKHFKKFREKWDGLDNNAWTKAGKFAVTAGLVGAATYLTAGALGYGGTQNIGSKLLWRMGIATGVNTAMTKLKFSPKTQKVMSGLLMAGGLGLSFMAGGWAAAAVGGLGGLSKLSLDYFTERALQANEKKLKHLKEHYDPDKLMENIPWMEKEYDKIVKNTSQIKKIKKVLGAVLSLGVAVGTVAAVSEHAADFADKDAAAKPIPGGGTGGSEAGQGVPFKEQETAGWGKDHNFPGSDKNISGDFKESVEVSSRGFIQTLADLKEKLRHDYGNDFSKAPHSVQEFMKTDNVKLSIELGGFDPNNPNGAESAMLLRGSHLGFDAQGNLKLDDVRAGGDQILIHGTPTGETVEKYHGKMFDSDHSQGTPAAGGASTSAEHAPSASNLPHDGHPVIAPAGAEGSTAEVKPVTTEYISGSYERTEDSIQKMIEGDSNAAKLMGWDGKEDLHAFAERVPITHDVLHIGNLLWHLKPEDALAIIKHDVATGYLTPEKALVEAHDTLLNLEFGETGVVFVPGIETDTWNQIKDYRASYIFEAGFKTPEGAGDFVAQLKEMSKESGIIPLDQHNESWDTFYNRLLKYKLDH